MRSCATAVPAAPVVVTPAVPVHGPRPVPEGHSRIARRFNAGFSDPPHDESPVGTPERFAHTFPQSSRRDSKEDNTLHQTHASMPGLFSCRPYGTWNTAAYPVNGYRRLMRCECRWHRHTESGNALAGHCTRNSRRTCVSRGVRPGASVCLHRRGWTVPHEYGNHESNRTRLLEAIRGQPPCRASYAKKNGKSA